MSYIRTWYSDSSIRSSIDYITMHLHTTVHGAFLLTPFFIIRSLAFISYFESNVIPISKSWSSFNFEFCSFLSISLLFPDNLLTHLCKGSCYGTIVVKLNSQDIVSEWNPAKLGQSSELILDEINLWKSNTTILICLFFFFFLILYLKSNP